MADPKKPDIDIAAALQTPEAQAAMQEMATKAAAAAIADLAARPSAPGSITDDMRALFSEMALGIAQMSHQGSGRAQPLAPAEMQKRIAAGEKLEALIAQVNANVRDAQHKRDAEGLAKWMPVYRVTGKIHFGERIIDPFRAAEVKGAKPIPQDIEWSGKPNDALRPLNAIAEDIFSLYREFVGLPTQLKPRSGPSGGTVAIDNRPYWLTIKGRVVQGTPPARATILSPGMEEPVQDEFADDAPMVRVLGTIAPPPQRNIGAAAAAASVR